MKLRVALTATAIALAMLFAQIGRADDAAAPAITTIEYSNLVQKIGGGEVDWGKQMMYASAEAPMQSADKQPNRVRAYLAAKDFAKMEAIARLLKVVEATTVTYQGSGKDLMDQDADLRQTIEGYINNVEIISSGQVKTEGGSAARVTVGTKIYGVATPGSAFLDSLAGTEKPKQPPLVELPYEISVTVRVRVDNVGQRSDLPASSRPFDAVVEVIAPPSQGPYTSVVVDARGYGVPQAISPKIRKLNGDEVYGILGAKTDPAIRQGTVSYAGSLNAARDCEKCGSNPLFVSAVGRGGGRSMCDVIVSDKAARQIAQENGISGFLDSRRVIFVVDIPGSTLPGSFGSQPVALSQTMLPSRTARGY